MRLLILSLAVLSVFQGNVFAATSKTKVETAQEKEWTLLVFLNGHNNLDPFGKADINEMEKVGSTSDINVVVQWASLNNGHTKRLFVTQDQDPNQVSSVVLEEMPAVDMGDYHNLIEFIRWGVQHYPAKKIFVDVWNHGSGWHSLGDRLRRAGVSIQDISSDDLSGNVITTEQLGQAMTEASSSIGKKIELYGSDACLMGMVEVASEMSDSVRYFVGSQELEPGDGWHYDRLLAEWAANPRVDGAGLGRILTRTYREGYGNKADGITLSVVNIQALAALEKAIQVFGGAVRALPQAAREKITDVIGKAQSFYYADYVDLGDFLKNLLGLQVQGFDEVIVGDALQALQAYTVASEASSSHPGATGVSIWLPSSTFEFDRYSTRYAGLKFAQRTGWTETLRSLLKP